jgi:hypothetical protein
MLFEFRLVGDNILFGIRGRKKVDWGPHRTALGKFSLVVPRQKFAVLKALGNYCVTRHCQGRQGVPLGMHRVNPEISNPEPSDPFVATDILLREEPEDEEDEEEHEGGEENDDEDDGYSE